MLPQGVLVTLALPGGIQDSNFGASNGVSDALVYYLPFCSHRAAFIARDIFRSTLKGTDIVIPGSLNKLFVHGVCRYLPYAASASLAEFFWGPVPFSRRKFPSLTAEDISDDSTDSFGFPSSNDGPSRRSWGRWWKRIIPERTPSKQWWRRFSRVGKIPRPERPENGTRDEIPDIDESITDEILPEIDPAIQESSEVTAHISCLKL